MIKEICLIVPLLTFSFLSAEPFYALMDSSSPNSVMTVRGLGALITLSLVSENIGYVAQKIGAITHYFHANKTISREEAVLISLKISLEKGLSSMEQQIKNYASLKEKPIAEFKGFSQLAAFIQNMKKHSKQKDFKAETILCAFKTNFLTDVEEPLSLKQLQQWLDDYKETSEVPATFIHSGEARLSLSKTHAKVLFGMLIHAMNYAGITLSQEINPS